MELHKTLTCPPPPPPLSGPPARYRHRATLTRAGRRQQQKQALEALSQLGPEEVRRLLGDVDLPGWVNYPDFERVAWCNGIIRQLYPSAGRAAAAWAEGNVDALLQANKPPWLAGIRLTHFTLGAVPPAVNGVKVYSAEESADDVIACEFDVAWAGEQDLTFTVRPVPKTKVRRAEQAVPSHPLELR